MLLFQLQTIPAAFDCAEAKEYFPRPRTSQSPGLSFSSVSSSNTDSDLLPDLWLEPKSNAHQFVPNVQNVPFAEQSVSPSLGWNYSQPPQQTPQQQQQQQQQYQYQLNPQSQPQYFPQQSRLVWSNSSSYSNSVANDINSLTEENLFQFESTSSSGSSPVPTNTPSSPGLNLNYASTYTRNTSFSGSSYEELFEFEPLQSKQLPIVCSGTSAKQPKTQQVNTQLYKTELCASFMKMAVCPYGNKCQFAHGEEELKIVERPPKWRSKPCANWSKYGTCRYGNRCCFKHEH